jgi:hypothetical protein
MLHSSGSEAALRYTGHVANDHYIPRFLTRPWEYAERRLRYFDFCNGRYEDVPSRQLFARLHLNSRHLETWLNETIETPLSRYVHGLQKSNSALAPKDWSSLRGLALFFILGPQRIAEASGERSALGLEELATWTESKIDDVARWVHQRFKFAVVATPYEMFFTEFVSFAYPMPESPVLAVPLGPWHALIAYEGPLPTADLLRHVDPSQLANFSVGIGRKVNRVILGPGWRAHSVNAPEHVRDHLFEVREGAVRIFNLVGEMSQRAGLKGWQVT